MESGRKSKQKKKKRMPTHEEFPEFPPEEAEWLLTICHAAGIGVADLGQLSKITQMEIALDDFNTLRPIGYFPHIRFLSFCATNVREMTGLDQLPELEELFLCENLIQEISGLHNCGRLRRLNLSNNKIVRISGIEHLTKLTSLWLNENKITAIENVSSLVHLHELWLASNQITAIGSNLNTLRQLETLNLAGNRIANFKEVLSLTILPQLSVLSFSDPNFGENPMCQLCNYQTYVLHHLSELTCLDSLMVSEDARMYAESTFMKKRMYYNMRIKTIQRSTTNLISQFEKLSRGRQEYLYSLIRELSWSKRRADQADRRADIEAQLQSAFGEISLVASFTAHLSEITQKVGEGVIYRLMTELDTGGNIRYEEGTSDDNWYKSCTNLIDSRYYPIQLSEFGLQELTVCKVVRIHNRMQRSLFEDHLEQLTDITSPGYKKQVDYLFIGQDPDQAGGLLHLVEHGFEAGGRISLVNSVGLADLKRVRHYYKSEAGEKMGAEIDRLFEIQEGAVAVPPGQLLICKVYLHDAVVDTERYAQGLTPEEVAQASPIILPQTCVIRRNEMDENQKIWFVNDSLLVLPEYLIEFDYTVAVEDPMFELTELSPAQHIGNWLGAYSKRDDLLQPTVSPPNTLAIPDTAHENILHLDLFNSGLSNVGWASDMVNLKELHVPFNQIVNLNLSACVSLEVVEAGWNMIRSIQMEACESLRHCELNNNELEELVGMSCNVESLLLFSNPITARVDYRRFVAEICPRLRSLDCIPITAVDTMPLSTVSDSQNQVTPDMIRANASFSKGGNLLSLGRYTRETSEIDTWSDDWERQVEVVQLNHMGIRSLYGVRNLIGLKKATFIDNELTSVDGLQTCVLLEELSLESNQLTGLEALSSLIYLKKLDLGKNHITSLYNFPSLDRLTQLSLENNRIDHLPNLGCLRHLMELYIGNNQLSRLKDLLNLKSNEKLIILDITGNPFCSLEESRGFTIYHLPRLKVLDGVPIEKQELQEAKLRFAGRLSQEVLESRLTAPGRNIKQLDLSRCKLRDLGGLVRYDSFPALAELNLSENSFVDLTGIEFLGCLHTLNLSRNGIETLYVGGVEVQQGLNALPSLKTLDISYNQLVDLNGLQYANLKDLRGLLAHHNAINRIEHLDMLKSLHNLDLAANKVREIGHNSFPPGNDIRSVRLDDNLLINLTHLGKLGSIEVLSLSSNKIKETFEIEKIADLPKLRELNLKGNPMTRKVQYRVGVLKRMPHLVLLDEKAVTEDEIDRVENWRYSGQPGAPDPSRLPPLVHYSNPPPQTVIAPKIPVKLTSVNFEGISPLLNSSSKREKTFDRSSRPNSSSNKPDPFLGFMSNPITSSKEPKGSGFPAQSKRGPGPRSSSQNKPKFPSRK